MSYDTQYKLAKVVAEVNNPLTATYVADLLGTRLAPYISRIAGIVAAEKEVFSDIYPDSADIESVALTRKKTR